MNKRANGWLYLAPGYPSEYLLDITDPNASNTLLDVKFSLAISTKDSLCLTFSASIIEYSSGSVSFIVNKWENVQV